MRAAPPILEVRAVEQGGAERQHSREWTLDGGLPSGDYRGPQPWMIDPRRSWGHPQDPIILSFKVDPANWQLAVDWIDAL